MENNNKPQTLKDLKKVMRKASNDRTSIVYGMFATSNNWGEFQFFDNNNAWLMKGEMSVLRTGDATDIIVRANKFLNPLGWEMVPSQSQRTVVINKL